MNAHEARRNKKGRIDDPLGLGNDRITRMAMMVWRDADWIYRALEKALTDEIGQAPADRRIELRSLTGEQHDCELIMQVHSIQFMIDHSIPHVFEQLIYADYDQLFDEPGPRPIDRCRSCGEFRSHPLHLKR